MGPSSFAEQDSKPTWHELTALEGRRREVLKRIEMPFGRILSHWSGTCLRALVMDWLIWLTMSIYIFIRYQARANGVQLWDPEQMGNSDVDILGSFLSFLLVLFVNQSNARFFSMYLLAKKCAGEIQDVAGLVTSIEPFPREAAHRIVRTLHAAHIAGYVGLGGPYGKQHFFDHFNQEHQLLTAGEMSVLEQERNLNMDMGPGTFKELITWCQKEVGRVKHAGHVDAFDASQINTHILNLRGAMGTCYHPYYSTILVFVDGFTVKLTVLLSLLLYSDGIYDYCDQPTQFFYVHFLCLLSALYLPLFAADHGYSAGLGQDSRWSIELLQGVIILTQCFFVVGLRLLGQIQVDPFGKDVEDLSVLTYISTTIENCNIICTAKPLQT